MSMFSLFMFAKKTVLTTNEKKCGKSKPPWKLKTEIRLLELLFCLFPNLKQMNKYFN